MYTARDFSQVTLRNNKFSISGQWFSLKFKRCKDSAEVTCADEWTVNEFFQKNRLLLLTLRNFIDYEKVDSSDRGSYIEKV